MAITWQTALKILGGGSATVIALFAVLFLLSGIEYTYTGDITCGETCESYINVTTTYWNICFENSGEKEILYKKSTFGRTLWVNLDKVDSILYTSPKVEVDWLVPAVGKDNWREIKSGDCWNRGKINKIKLVGHKDKEQTIKWGFNIEDKIEIDPIWMGTKVICNPDSKTEIYGETKANTITKLYQYEDAECKEIQDAKSLINHPNLILKNLEKDNDFDLELVDFNSTSITYNVIIKNSSYLSTNIPIKIDGTKVKDVRNDLLNEKNQIILNDIDVFNQNVSIGFNTTTSIITTNISLGIYWDTYINVGQAGPSEGETTIYLFYKSGSGAQYRGLNYVNLTYYLNQSNVNITDIDFTVVTSDSTGTTVNATARELSIKQDPTTVTYGECGGDGCESYARDLIGAYNLTSSSGQYTNLTIPLDYLIAQRWYDDDSSNNGTLYALDQFSGLPNIEGKLVYSVESGPAVSPYYNITYDILIVNVPPNDVELNLPSNNSRFNDNITITFDWSNTTDNNSDLPVYYLEIANDTDFTQFMYVNTSISEIANTTNDIVTFPNETKDYYWRVLAYDASLNSSWSEVRNISLFQTPSPIPICNITSIYLDGLNLTSRKYEHGTTANITVETLAGTETCYLDINALGYGVNYASGSGNFNASYLIGDLNSQNFFVEDAFDDTEDAWWNSSNNEDPDFPYSNSVDENWSSYSDCDGDFGCSAFIFENFTIPDGAIGAFVQTKFYCFSDTNSSTFIDLLYYDYTTQDYVDIGEGCVNNLNVTYRIPSNGFQTPIQLKTKTAHGATGTYSNHYESAILWEFDSSTIINFNMTFGTNPQYLKFLVDDNNVTVTQLNYNMTGEVNEGNNPTNLMCGYFNSDNVDFTLQGNLTGSVVSQNYFSTNRQEESLIFGTAGTNTLYMNLSSSPLLNYEYDTGYLNLTGGVANSESLDSPEYFWNDTYTNKTYSDVNNEFTLEDFSLGDRGIWTGNYIVNLGENIENSPLSCSCSGTGSCVSSSTDSDSTLFYSTDLDLARFNSVKFYSSLNASGGCSANSCQSFSTGSSSASVQIKDKNTGIATPILTLSAGFSCAAGGDSGISENIDTSIWEVRKVGSKLQFYNDGVYTNEIDYDSLHEYEVLYSNTCSCTAYKGAASSSTSSSFNYMNASGITGKQIGNFTFNNGTYTSQIIGNFSNNLSSAVLLATEWKPAGTDIYYYLSPDGGLTWEEVQNGVGHVFTAKGTDLMRRINVTGTGVQDDELGGQAIVKDVDVRVSSSYPENISIDIGADGVYEWNNSNAILYGNESTTASWINSSVMSYLTTNCGTLNKSNCLVPIAIYSDSSSLLIVNLLDQNLTLNYISEPNPDRFTNYLSTNSTLIPLYCSSDTPGIVTLKNMDLRYRGDGNVTIVAHNQDYTHYDNRTIEVRLSPFRAIYPPKIDSLFFPLWNSTQYNATPYGQVIGYCDVNNKSIGFCLNASIPIYNITTQARFDDITILPKWNETAPGCIEIIASRNEQFNNTINMTTAGQELLNISRTSLETQGIWLKANLYGCNSTSLMMWNPYTCLDSLCVDCVRTLDYDQPQCQVGL